MRLATAEQALSIDRLSVSESGLTEDGLMEQAGRAMAERFCRLFPKSQDVLIFCGLGHNGGDGLVMARHLAVLKPSLAIDVALVGKSHRMKPLTKTNWDRLTSLTRVRRLEVNSKNLKEEVEAKCLKSRWIVDALFGVGLARPIDDPLNAAVIESINASAASVIAVDGPSGLDLTRGLRLGPCVEAEVTFTLGVVKPGLLIGDGAFVSGHIYSLDIGFPSGVIRQVARTHRLVTRFEAARWLPSRSARANKTDFGHTLVIAGHAKSWGAGVLASHAAFRCGSGYVTWASHEAPLAALKAAPEVFCRRFDEVDWSKIDSVVVGPGLGTGPETEEILERLLERFHQGPVIADADALTVLARQPGRRLPEDWVLTPHAGELARLQKTSSKDIEADRLTAVTAAAHDWGCAVLLKGHRSILAWENNVAIIASGNVALAKAGTGDVLSGMIGGFQAQGLKTAQAAALGAYVHGRMANEWVQSGRDRAALMASDLAEQLPGMLAELRALKKPRRMSKEKRSDGSKSRHL